MKKNKKWIIGAVVIALVLAFVFWPKDKAASYNSTVVQRGDLETYYSFSGNVVANNHKDYVVGQDYVIAEFYVENGDQVEVGDLLYRLDPASVSDTFTQTEAALQIAKNNYASTLANMETQKVSIENTLELAKRSFMMAETNYNNYLQLYTIGGVSQLEVDAQMTSYMQAMANLKNAQTAYDAFMNTTYPTTLSTAKASYDSSVASYNTTMDKLGDIEVHAEIAGEVTYRTNEVGSKLDQGLVLSITDFNSLAVSIKVDEYDISSITMGKEADIYISSLGESVEGMISNLSKNANAVSGIAFFNAEVSLPYHEHILEGMSAEVKILNSSASDTLLIPMEALQFTDHNEAYVLVKQGNEMVEKMVEVGINDGVTVEIISGIEEGETIYFMNDLLYQMMTGGR